MTIRGVPDEVAGKLLRSSRERGRSLNATALGELEGAFELGSRVRAIRMSLAELLSEPFVSVVPTVIAESIEDGEIARKLELRK